MASSSSAKVSLKLLIDKNTERVLFAEASKDFVDFLSDLLGSPIGSLIRLAKLYRGIEKHRNTNLMNRSQDKDNHGAQFKVRHVGKKAVEATGFCGEGGYVKGVVTYIVMDDLAVHQLQPMSIISSITLLNKFNIKEFGVLQERVVELETAEGIQLMKASLQSENVLTSVFLRIGEHLGRYVFL